MAEIEQTVCKQIFSVKLWLLYSNTWNYLTVCKQMSSGLFKNVIYEMCLQIIYIWLLVGLLGFMAYQPL